MAGARVSDCHEHVIVTHLRLGEVPLAELSKDMQQRMQ